MSGPRTALALGAVLAAPLAARAYRPFNSTDAAVAEKGQVEIELGPFGLVQEGSDRWLVAPSVILNWGFADRWELVLEGRHFVHLGAAVAEPRLRVEDAAVSLKTVLREGSRYHVDDQPLGLPIDRGHEVHLALEGDVLPIPVARANERAGTGRRRVRHAFEAKHGVLCHTAFPRAMTSVASVDITETSP